MIGDEFVRHKWSSRLAPLVIQYVNARLLIISEKCNSINVNIHWTTIFHKISTGQQYFLSEVQVRSRLLASGPFWILLFIRLRVFGTQQSNATTRLACLNWNSFVFVYVFEFYIFVFVFFCICVFVIVYLHSSMYLWSCTCSSRPSVWLACLAAAQPRWPAATFQWAAQAPLINTSPHVLQILCATSNPRVRPKIYNPFQYLEAAECFGEGRNTGFACFQLTFNYLTRGDWNFWLFGQKQKKYQFTGKNIKLVQQSKTLSSAWQAFQLQTHDIL